MAAKIVDWDIDEAAELCSENGKHCTYWQTAKGPRGWYVTTVVGNRIAIEDDGPYQTEARAYCAGFEEARNWLFHHPARLPAEEDFAPYVKKCNLVWAIETANRLRRSKRR